MADENQDIQQQQQAAAPAPAPAVASTVTSTEAPETLRDIVASLDYDTSGFKDDRELAQGLLQSADAYNQSRPLINYGRRYVEHAAEFEKWLETQEQTKQQQQVQEKPKFSWPNLEYNPEWDRLTKLDPNIGEYIPVNEYVSPAVAQHRNTFVRQQREALNRLLKDPVGLFKEGASDWIQEQINQGVAGAIKQYQAQQQAQQYLAEKQGEFYQLDESGRVRFDTQNREVLSQKGEAALQFAQEARQLGFGDPAKIQFYVDRMLSAYDALVGQSQQQQNTDAEPQAPRNNKKRFLDRVRQTNRSGTTNGSDGDEVQSREMSAKEITHQELRRRGLLPQTG